MKIGILTLPFNNNYGGFLQAYALMTVLKHLKHEPTLLYRRPNRYEPSYAFKIKFFLKNIISSIIDRKKYPFIWRQEVYYKYRGKNMHTFLNKYIIPRTEPLYSSEELKLVCKNKFDAIIVGSDQVWRPDYVDEILDYFLEFAVEFDVKRIAYAASFGTAENKFSDVQSVRCGDLLSMFDAISVRENSGIDLINKKSWNVKTVACVLDPTMLLPIDIYENIIKGVETADGGLFCYVLDSNVNSLLAINNLSRILKLRVNKISDIQRGRSVLPSVEEWLSNIYNADYVITDSFHGMIFSIIFNKEFAVFVNQERGADRFYSILSKLDLNNRIINSADNISCLASNKIDWEMVNQKINYLRDKSIHFLVNALNSKYD